AHEEDVNSRRGYSLPTTRLEEEEEEDATERFTTVVGAPRGKPGDGRECEMPC
ncbi:unnamed protein product, partial [Heterotrigona itama]